MKVGNKFRVVMREFDMVDMTVKNETSIQVWAKTRAPTKIPDNLLDDNGDQDATRLTPLPCRA